MGPICNCARSYPNRHPINQFLPLAIEVFGCFHRHVNVFLHDYANAIWSLKGIEGPHLFTLITFFCQKVLIHITNDSTIFHLKLGDSYRFNYFSTSTPSKHTSHDHNRSIASCWLLTYKYGRPFTCGQLWTWTDFQSYFEPTWCLVTSPFFFILIFCTFP